LYTGNNVGFFVYMKIIYIFVLWKKFVTLVTRRSRRPISETGINVRPVRIRLGIRRTK
jgi:hypothetical protein